MPQREGDGLCDMRNNSAESRYALQREKSKLYSGEIPPYAAREAFSVSCLNHLSSDNVSSLLGWAGQG